MRKEASPGGEVIRINHVAAVVGNRDFGKTGPPQLRPVFPAIKAKRVGEGKLEERERE